MGECERLSPSLSIVYKSRSSDELSLKPVPLSKFLEHSSPQTMSQYDGFDTLQTSQ